MSTSSERALESYSEWLDPRFRQLLLFQAAFGYAYAALLLAPKFATVALGATPREVGTIAAFPVLATLIAAPLMGFWLDRGSHLRAMRGGAFLLVVSVGTFGYVHSVGPALYALRLVQGLANALIVGGCGVLVTRLVPAGHHGRAFGTAGAASLMMNAVASTATERLADTFGWTIAYEVAGGVSAFALGLALVQGDGGATARSTVANGSAGTESKWLATGAATLAAGAGFGMLVTFTQPYALSLGATHVASLFTGYTLTALMVRLGLGGAVDRWGRRRAAFVALSLYSLAVLAAAALRPGYLFALGLGFGAAHGLAWPSLCALSVEHAPAGRAGSALGRTQALFAAGTMLAVSLGGHVVSAFGYPLTFIGAGIAVAFGALALLKEASA
jgi:MFS family permease